MTGQFSIADAPLPVLLIRLATRSIIDVSDALVKLTGYTRDELLGSDPASYLKGSSSPALPLLVSGQILGYERSAVFHPRSGPDTEVRIWVHAMEPERPPTSALVVVDEDVVSDLADDIRGVDEIAVLGTADADWRVDRITTGVSSLLGYDVVDVVGEPFLGAVHPGDVAELLTGLGHALGSGRSVVVRVRIRGSDGGWRWCRACLAPLVDTAGFAFLVTPATAAGGVGETLLDMRERLVRIAYEVQAARALPQTGAVPPTAQLSGLDQLSPREVQILAALRGGKRSTEIAREFSLASSTVRNHLATIYRKLGVTSQVELLATLSAGNERERMTAHV